MAEPAEAHEDERPEWEPILKKRGKTFHLVEDPSQLAIDAIPGFRIAHFPEEGGVYLDAEPFPERLALSPNLLKEDSPPPTKGKGKEKAPALSRENPLHVKGSPGKRVAEEDMERLRKFFQVAPRPADLPADAKDRQAVLKASRVPRWSIAAVEANPANLKQVLDGTLNKDTFQAVVGSRPRVSTRPAGRAQAKWLEVKTRYQGETLEAAPRTQRQKSFRKDYDALVAEFGSQPTLPKPRKGRPSSRGRESSRPSQRPMDATDLIASLVAKVLQKALA
jgi:hypothetical protein